MRRQLLTILAAALVLATLPAAANPQWDRVANVKDAAQRLAALHRQQGSNGVLKFLDACYRTHTLASEFSQALESCMAQDYMHSRILAEIYGRLPEAERARLNTPTPALIARTMNDRFAAVFQQYKVSRSEAEAFRKLVDTYGMPVFLKAVFPKPGAGKPESKRD